MAPHRGHGSPRRGRLSLHRRAEEGPHHPRGLQHLPARGGGGALRVPEGRGGRRGRHARSAHGRGRARLRRPEGRRGRDARGGHGLLRDAPRAVQVPEAGAPRPVAAEESDREDPQEGTARAGMREGTMADDTLARMFWSRVERSAAGPAQQCKRAGGWQTSSWREVGEMVREAALGLIALGRSKGDAVGLLSTTRPEWVQADFAIFSVGGRTIPIYPTYPPDLIQYIVNDADIKTLIVEDPGQLEKVIEVKGKMDGLEQVVVIDGYQGREPWVMTWDALRQLGRDNAERLKSALAGRVADARPEDIATIVYTSGTTGPPKGVVQTHGNHVAMLKSSEQTLRVNEGEVHLLFLPLAHSFGRLESFAGVYRGLTTAFAENIEDRKSTRLNSSHLGISY